MKLVLAMVLVSSLFGTEAFAQSAIRADEKIKYPQEYRLGNSEGLLVDQAIVDHVKAEQQKRQDLIRPGQMKRLLKYRDMI